MSLDVKKLPQKINVMFSYSNFYAKKIHNCVVWACLFKEIIITIERCNDFLRPLCEHLSVHVLVSLDPFFPMPFYAILIFNTKRGNLFCGGFDFLCLCVYVCYLIRCEKKLNLFISALIKDGMRWK